MSVLGDRYDYDVFFSYAWATPTGVPYLRDWTRAIADTVSVDGHSMNWCWALSTSFASPWTIHL